MKKADLRKILVGAIDDISSNYERLSETSYNEMIKALPQGAKLPAKEGLHTEAAKYLFDTYRGENRDKVKNAINEVMGTISAAQSAAPPADVSTALLLMSMRNNLSEAELQAFYDAHGNNYQINQALRSIATDKDLHPDFLKTSGSETASAVALLKGIQKNVEGFIDSATPSSAYAAFQKMGLEDDLNALPIE